MMGMRRTMMMMRRRRRGEAQGMEVDNHEDDEADEAAGAGEISYQKPEVKKPVLDLNSTKHVIVIGDAETGKTNLIELLIVDCDPVHRKDDGSYLVGFMGNVLHICECGDLGIQVPDESLLSKPGGFILCSNVLQVNLARLDQWVQNARARSSEDARVAFYGARADLVPPGSENEISLIAFSHERDGCRYFSGNIFNGFVEPHIAAMEYLVDFM